jgi:hypothetical protein
MGQPGDSGDLLAVDLYELLKVAEDYVPSVADLFNTALTGLRSASTSLGAAMQRPDYFWGATSPVQQPLLDLMHTVDGFVAGTKAALDDTGRALVTAVDRYAESDDRARQALAFKRAHDGEPHRT